MACRVAARFVSRRFSAGGKVLSEEEKAAENVYIKKMEQEKLEKLARQGLGKPGERAPASSEVPASEAKSSGPTPSSSAGISTDKDRNYAVLAGTIAALSAFGWYYLSKPSKKAEEIAD